MTTTYTQEDCSTIVFQTEKISVNMKDYNEQTQQMILFHMNDAAQIQ